MQTHTLTVVQEVGGWNSLTPSVFGTLLYDTIYYIIIVRYVTIYSLIDSLLSHLQDGVILLDAYTNGAAGVH